jgi:hypothetical protein
MNRAIAAIAFTLMASSSDAAAKTQVAHYCGVDAIRAKAGTGRVGRGDNFEVDGKTAQEYFSDERVVRLVRASCNEDTTSVEDLLKQGVSPNALSDDRSISVLGWSMNCLGLQGMEILLKAGADPNMRLLWRTSDGDYSFTVVTKAAEGLDPRPLMLLLKHGGDPNARLSGENASTTALSFAFQLGTHELGWDNYYALISAGASISQRDDRTANTIVEEAAGVRRYDKVEELLEMGYNSRLDYLAMLIQDDRFLKIPEQLTEEGLCQNAWATRVNATLVARGVQLPVPETTDLSEEFKARNAERAERAKKPGGLLFNP